MSTDNAADLRLATYGTLAPGRANHHHLAGLVGAWSKGIVKGRLVEAGWGAELGFPGLVLDPTGDDIAVDIFTSPDLPRHWDRLDEFEGAGYRRVVVQVTAADGEIEASIYVIAGSE